ncbi:MAG: hypothetical protein SF052_01930 [Bacteroidia bacterium]|nr:hypothetical protein [Bacteroidia bacterium]
MLIPIVFAVCLVFAGALVIWGLSTHRKFTQLENLHREFARKMSLHIAYTHEKDFTIFGRFRDYPVKVTPFDKFTKPACLCFSIPMINPNLKWLKISKNLSGKLDDLTQNDKSIIVNHPLSQDIRIETNDLMFSGLILSENVKISLHDTFKDLTEGLLYIEGETMNFILPRMLAGADHHRKMVGADHDRKMVGADHDRKMVGADHDLPLPAATKIIHLMCDMKDELN